MNRTNNVIRNIRWGIMQRIVGIILPFIVRTVLIYSLSASYAGLSGLFASVLSVLSLAELGISNAIVYSMYKPVSEGDESKVCALLNVYRKAYRIIGLVIVSFGLFLMPFLQYLIHGSVPDDVNVYLLFGIYLFNTVISYFLYGYKSCILSVNQRQDVLSKISIITRMLLQILQCTLLLYFRSYYLYVIVIPLATIAENLLYSYWVTRLYPQYVPRGSIDEEEYTGLKRRVSGLLIWKVGGATRNTLDSIAVSMYLGLVTVTIYNNYWLIINAVSSFLRIIISSMLASVGNKIATNTPEVNYKDFHKFHFIYMWIAGWCTICMMCLYQPFMKQWMGDKLMFSNGIMLLFCYLFFMLKQGDINSVYYQAAGLWWEGRWRSVIEAVSNLTLNFLLGKYFGVVGILMATIISYNIAYFYGSKFTFTCYFKNDKLKVFYLDNLIYLMITVASGFITYRMIGTIFAVLSSHIVKNIIALLICVIVPNTIFLLLYSMNKQTKQYISYGLKSAKRMIGRIQ